MTRNEHDMSREEAIDLLDNLIGMVDDNHGSDYDTALKMAKKALEFIDKIADTYGDMLDIPTQEPSSDAISRQDAYKCLEIYGEYDTLNEAYERLQKLPSVKPQEPTGYWIWQTEDIYQCSECHEDIHVKEVMNKPQYICCPICGCPMEIER